MANCDLSAAYFLNVIATVNAVCDIMHLLVFNFFVMVLGDMTPSPPPPSTNFLYGFSKPLFPPPPFLLLGAFKVFSCRCTNILSCMPGCLIPRPLVSYLGQIFS